MVETLYELNHPATNNSSTSNKGNSSSTNNTAGGQSNKTIQTLEVIQVHQQSSRQPPSNSESSGVPSTDDSKLKYTKVGTQMDPNSATKDIQITITLFSNINQTIVS